MPKIITLTLNLAIDKIVEIADFRAGDVFKVDSACLFPAGKGINVARAISGVRRQIVVLGLVGEGELPFFNSVASENVKVDLTPVKGLTRTNLTVCDPVNNTETHIRDKGFTASETDIKSIGNKLRQYVDPDDIVVFSGSLPEGLSKDTYYNLGKLCRELGAKVVLDSSGEALKQGLRCRPYFIKPNLEELEGLCDSRLNTEKEIAYAAKEVADHYQIALVVVSLGEKGALAYSHGSGRCLRATSDLQRWNFIPHSVGSGDAFVAAVCCGILNGETPMKLILDGVAYGTANLFTIGPGIINDAFLSDIRQNVHVTEFPL